MDFEIIAYFEAFRDNSLQIFEDSTSKISTSRGIVGIEYEGKTYLLLQA